MKWRDLQALGVSAKTIQDVRNGIDVEIRFETVEKILASAEI